MVLRHIIVRLLAVFLIVGLVAAPLITPAVAGRLVATATTDTYAMPSDMSCCPDGHTQDGCKDCPLTAMCTLTVVQAAAPDASGMQVSFNVRQLQLAPDDMVVDGLIGAPPDHPPRLSI